MSVVSVREVTPVDVDALCALGRETFAETFAHSNTEEDMREYLEDHFSIVKVREEVANRNSLFYFAVIDNTPVGYLKLNVGDAQTEIKTDDCLEIERIYVLQAHQRQRVGQTLYEKAVEVAKTRGAEYIWLGVWEKNLKAIAFYHRNGFVDFDKHEFVLGNDHQTDIMMKRVLKDGPRA